MLTLAHSWAVGLVLLPLLVYWLAPPRPCHRPVVRVPFYDRVRESSAGGADGAGSPSQRLSWIGRSLVWILIVIALARPQWVEEPIERRVPTRDLLLAVDLSGSMEKEDFTDANGQTADRLTAVKEVLGEFLTKREGDRVGLVVFGNSPFLQTPFTTDLELCRQLLDETSVRMAGPRTALGDAIGLGIQLFEESSAPSKTMIALTDGNDTGSGVPPVEAARVAADRGIHIHTVAMGDPETVGEEKLDQAALEGVAKTSGGRFFLAMNRDELVGIYEELDRMETSEVETVSHRPRSDLYHWPLAMALLLSLGAQGWFLLRDRVSTFSSADVRRVRVNVRTHELEVTGQS